MFFSILQILGSSLLLSDWPDLYEASQVTPSQSDDVAFIISIEDYAYAPDIPGARENALAWETFLGMICKSHKSLLCLTKMQPKKKSSTKQKH